MKAKLGDAAVVGVLVLLFVLLGWFMYLPKTENTSYIEITQNGGHFRTALLDEDAQITVETPNGNVTVTVENGRAFVSSADCPDGLCMTMKPLESRSYDGASIICMPCGVCVVKKSESAGESEADAVAG